MLTFLTNTRGNGIDCEQSRFFFRFSGSNARARSGEAVRRAKRGRQPEPSVTRVAICLSRVLLDGLQKKTARSLIRSSSFQDSRFPVLYFVLCLVTRIGVMDQTGKFQPMVWNRAVFQLLCTFIYELFLSLCNINNPQRPS